MEWLEKFPKLLQREAASLAKPLKSWPPPSIYVVELCLLGTKRFENLREKGTEVIWRWFVRTFFSNDIVVNGGELLRDKVNVDITPLIPQPNPVICERTQQGRCGVSTSCTLVPNHLFEG